MTDSSPIRPLSLGPLRLDSNLLLAPISGWADLAFRLAIREIGGIGIAYTPLALPEGIVHDTRESREVVETRSADAPLGVQLFGRDARSLSEAARILESRGYALIDFNLGCPVKKVTRAGAGAALLAVPDEAARLAADIARAVAIPVTAKVRLGPDESREVAPELVRLLEEAGVAAVTVHGRFASEDYDAPVRLDRIARAVAAAVAIPVVANGGVDSPGSARRTFEATGCAGVMIGRAALRDPWVFRRLHAGLAGEDFPEPSHDERARFVRSHFDTLLAARGEARACALFRKFADSYGTLLGLTDQARAAWKRLESPGGLARLLAR